MVSSSRKQDFLDSAESFLHHVEAEMNEGTVELQHILLRDSIRALIENIREIDSRNDGVV